ncbi:MAG TPA: SDR family NAD(P)-dependent oxidoreductase [Myxococcota bacterium]|nr:SDR family NAD(P)-dependent oxidoreductase [Myxococcota bacterium]
MTGSRGEFATRYGPCALIAGASEGIGAAFARELAHRGLDLVLVARRPEPLAALEREIASFASVRVHCLPLDLARADACAEIERALAGEEVGLVVYNAALAPGGPFLELPLDRQLAALDVNTRGPLALAHAFGRRMASRGRGGLVLMSSLTAFQGSPFVATYGATKSFLLSLAEGLWYELSPNGVDVLCVLAGATRTPNYLRHRAQGGAPGELEPEQVAREALAKLGRAPSMIPGRFNRFASQLLRRVLPRRAAIRIMGAQTEKLSHET